MLALVDDQSSVELLGLLLFLFLLARDALPSGVRLEGAQMWAYGAIFTVTVALAWGCAAMSLII